MPVLAGTPADRSSQDHLADNAAVSGCDSPTIFEYQ
jgi:hypothetical protein